MQHTRFIDQDIEHIMIDQDIESIITYQYTERIKVDQDI